MDKFEMDVTLYFKGKNHSAKLSGSLSRGLLKGKIIIKGADFGTFRIRPFSDTAAHVRIDNEIRRVNGINKDVLEEIEWIVSNAIMAGDFDGDPICSQLDADDFDSLEGITFEEEKIIGGVEKTLPDGSKLIFVEDNGFYKAEIPSKGLSLSWKQGDMYPQVCGGSITNGYSVSCGDNSISRMLWRLFPEAFSILEDVKEESKPVTATELKALPCVIDGMSVFVNVTKLPGTLGHKAVLYKYDINAGNFVEGNKYTVKDGNVLNCTDPILAEAIIKVIA